MYNIYSTQITHMLDPILYSCYCNTMSVNYFIIISSIWARSIMNSKPIKPHVNYENRHYT